MKFSTSQMLVFLQEHRTQRNVRSLMKFILILTVLIVAYSILFHVIMEHEGQDHSWITGFYWTLTVMSTLGFGDITFESDLGRAFSMIVLVTGIVFLLVLLPFTIIQFLYAPWVDAVEAARTPRQVREDMSGHVILIHHDAVTEDLIVKLEQSDISYVLLVPDFDDASRLHDMGVHVIFGPLDLVFIRSNGVSCIDRCYERRCDKHQCCLYGSSSRVRCPHCRDIHKSNNHSDPQTCGCNACLPVG